MRSLTRSLLLLLGGSLVGLTPLRAQVATMVRGEHASIMIGAPEGWVLNDQLARQFNVPVAICAKDQSVWPGVLIYIATVPKGPGCRSLTEYLTTYRSQMEQAGNKLTVVRQRDLKGNRGALGQVYHYSGLASQRLEANAFFENPDSVDMVVISAPNAEMFQKSLPVFAEVVGTYGSTPLKPRVEAADPVEAAAPTPVRAASPVPTRRPTARPRS